MQVAGATPAATNPRPRRCTSGAASRGHVSFESTGQNPGSIVTGRLDAELLECDDGTTARVTGTFKVAITDLK
jgi:hypothetical protein